MTTSEITHKTFWHWFNFFGKYLYFLKPYFTKQYFPKQYFLKQYFPKPYFTKQYFPKQCFLKQYSPKPYVLKHFLLKADNGNEIRDFDFGGVSDAPSP